MRLISLLLTIVAASAVSPALASYTVQDANAGAQLRAEASIAVSLLYFPCHRAPAMEAPLARYEAFKAGLTNDRQKIDLAIAEADFDYQMSLVDIDCPDPDAPETAQRDEINAAVVTSVLDRMDTLKIPADLAEPEKGQ